MDLFGKKIGIGITGSFCTINDIKKILIDLKKEGGELFPFISSSIDKYDTRFGLANNFIEEIEEICNREVISTIVEAEKFGPLLPLDTMVMLPLTGNSLGKLANGINDSAPLMGAKTTLRNSNPVVIALFTNDALGISGQNIFKLVNSKNFYFVPFGQDNYILKPNSMTANLDLTIETIKMALDYKQIQPMIIENFM